MLFPPGPVDGPQTSIELDTTGDTLPTVLWTGLVHRGQGDPGGLPLLPNGPGMPLLGEHSHERFTRPHLRGHRLGTDGRDLTAGHAWSTRFSTRGVTATATVSPLTCTSRTMPSSVTEMTGISGSGTARSASQARSAVSADVTVLTTGSPGRCAASPASAPADGPCARYGARRGRTT